MARNSDVLEKDEKKEKDKQAKEQSILNDKSFKRQLQTLNNMIGQANLNLYGTDRNSDVESLNNKFQEIMSKEINDLTNGDDQDVSSFLGNLVSSDNKSYARNNFFNTKNMSISADDMSSMSSFIMDAYKNRLLEQSDIHEVSSSLIELSEAILITRDAIISPDILEGRLSRDLRFENMSEDEAKNNVSMVENMEERFDLHNKIKNFIVPKTLEYGEYYAYTIPYSELFNDFQNQQAEIYSKGTFRFNESTLDLEDHYVMESFINEVHPKIEGKGNKEFALFIESTYEEYTKHDKTATLNEHDEKITETVSKEEFEKDVTNILNNITVNNDPVPLAVVDEGVSSYLYMKEVFMEKSNEKAKGSLQTDYGTVFDKVKNGNLSSEGIFTTNDKDKKKNEFDDIVDCYIKLMEPLKVLPLEIMNEVIGYYYVDSDEITPLGGAVSGSLYLTKFDNGRKEATVIDAIAERVIKSFNKKFLEKNAKFKKLIVECLNYYNLNEKKIRFQFIPVEYMQVFKIDVDENGHGQSMIKKSLFYAKLYLMLLLFKIMSIILYSNDQRVNYLKRSGIDKDTANQVQEIARLKQARQINITDLFSYTTLINKVGNGAEQYIPVGRSGERPIETEILSGQEVQLNPELLEMLKNAYILGTGVPAGLINYLNEADFAKQLELNNTKFAGRVVNYQLDFNKYITAWYKKIMRWSTNIDSNAVDNFLFVLQPPKITNNATRSDAIGQFQSEADFVVQIMYPDPNASMNADQLNQEIRIFRRLLANERMPMLDMDKMKELKEKARLEAQEERLTPDPSNGDNGDDLGLDTSDLGGNPNDMI